MFAFCRPFARVLLPAFVLCHLIGSAAAHELRLALQATGTAKWEMAAMRDLGIDKAHDLVLDIRDVADSRAGQIALQAGEADVILSDFVWVSIQRSTGNLVTLVPHSLAVGGLMVDPEAGISIIADLKGKTLAVSGSPVDKTYVVLAADYNQLTGGNLADDADVRFGAPPLVNEMLLSGQADAALNLWNWNARAKLAEKIELISMPQMLAVLGIATTPPLLGWTFFESTARTKPAAIDSFLAASLETKKALLADDALWDKIRPAMNVGDDDALFMRLRDGYRAGIIEHHNSTNVAAAAEFFEVMAAHGGIDVVGDTGKLAPGTFWEGSSK